MSVKTKLIAIANAIRGASYVTDEMTIQQMINNVPYIKNQDVIATPGLIDKSLTTYTIPSGVTSIGERVFSNFNSLISVTIPSGVTSIGDLAFSSCKSLKSVTIPNGVRSIGQSFSDCSALTSVTIPSSVTDINIYAFLGCSNLTNIYCGFAQGAVSGAPWGASNATIHYNS